MTRYNSVTFQPFMSAVMDTLHPQNILVIRECQLSCLKTYSLFRLDFKFYQPTKMDAFKGSYTRTGAEQYEEFLKVMTVFLMMMTLCQDDFLIAGS